MIDPRSSDLFAVGRTSTNDIETAVLDCEAVRRSAWFGRVVPDIAPDGRYVPVYAAGADHAAELIVLDLETDAYRRLASVRPDGPTPAVHRETGDVIVAPDTSVIAAAPDGSTRRTVGAVGRSDRLSVDRGVGNRSVVSAGLTVSADGDKIGLGFDANGSFCVGALDATTEETAAWHERSRRFATVRFSPTDPSLLLFALDADPGTSAPSAGEAWLAREGLGARPLDELLPDRHHGHWWEPDGTGLWYVAPGSGVEYLDLELGRREVVWSASTERAHATLDGRLVAATTRGADPTVVVYDRDADASTVVACAASPTSTPYPGVQPQFVGDDEYLAHTTSVDGERTVAFTPVDAIRERI